MTAIPVAEASGLGALDRLHTIVCDSCRRRFRDEGDGFYGFVSPEQARESAAGGDCETSGGWDYCPDCRRGAGS